MVGYMAWLDGFFSWPEGGLQMDETNKALISSMRRDDNGDDANGAFIYLTKESKTPIESRLIIYLFSLEM